MKPESWMRNIGELYLYEGATGRRVRECDPKDGAVVFGRSSGRRGPDVPISPYPELSRAAGAFVPTPAGWYLVNTVRHSRPKPALHILCFDGAFEGRLREGTQILLPARRGAVSFLLAEARLELAWVLVDAPAVDALTPASEKVAGTLRLNLATPETLKIKITQRRLETVAARVWLRLKGWGVRPLELEEICQLFGEDPAVERDRRRKHLRDACDIDNPNLGHLYSESERSTDTPWQRRFETLVEALMSTGMLQEAFESLDNQVDDDWLRPAWDETIDG